MNTPKKLANTTENVNHYQIHTLQTAQITNKQHRYRHKDKSKTPLNGVNKTSKSKLTMIYELMNQGQPTKT